MDRTDRYLRIVRWAERRYARNGWIVTHIGREPQAAVRIERAAWLRYMGD